LNNTHNEIPLLKTAEFLNFPASAEAKFGFTQAGPIPLGQGERNIKKPLAQVPDDYFVVQDGTP